MLSLKYPVVALTGGIGSGKSEAAAQFVKLGIPIVDVDVIAHELTTAGKPILADIARIFGKSFLTAGALDRAKLREHVFKNPAERLKLETLLHPAIYEHTLNKLMENEAYLHPPYQLLVIPLLFENNRYASIVQKSLVIDCDESLQIKRVGLRSKIPEAEISAIIATQVPRTTRLKLADEVVENNGSLAELQEKITVFHKKFIKTCIVSK